MLLDILLTCILACDTLSKQDWHICKSTHTNFEYLWQITLSPLELVTTYQRFISRRKCHNFEKQQML